MVDIFGALKAVLLSRLRPVVVVEDGEKDGRGGEDEEESGRDWDC